MKYALREVLSKFKWDSRFRGKRSNIEIIILDRLVSEGKKIIRFPDVKEVGSSYIIYGENKWIPLHRILEIKDSRSGVVYWKKKEP